MKKFLPAGLGFLFVLLTFHAHSQDSTKMMLKGDRHVSFGIEAGVNLANVVSRGLNNDRGADIILLPFGGIYVSIPSGKGFAIQPEVVYNGLGWKVIPYPATKDTNYLFTCISVPLLAKYSFENTGLAIFLGPQVDFLLSAKVKRDNSVSIKDQFKSSGFTAVAGAQYVFAGGFNVSLRYQLGLSNLIKTPAPKEYLKLHAITFNLGYTF